MSEAQSEAPGGRAAEIGLALLFEDGVAEAMAAAEATLATAQGGAARVLGELARVQAVGTAAAAVPPVWRESPQPADPPDRPIEPSSNAPRADRVAPVASGTIERKQDSYAPASSWGSRSASSEPVPLAAQVSSPPPPSAPALVPEPVGASGDPDSVPTIAPIPLASLAPNSAPALTFAAAADEGRAPYAAEEVGPWRASAPGRGESEWRAPAAPVGVARESLMPGPQARQDAPARQGSPIGGDVFLDGTRVGTWLADHLAREAGRPQSGATGFDPRLSPAWPGTLQGN